MSIARNTIYNVAGATAPLVLALVIIPIYVRHIGEARYGVLAIVWLLLGYFGLFDLGLSRATSQQVARLKSAPPDHRQEVFWSSCVLNAAFGAIGGLLVYVAGRPLLGQWLKMSVSLHTEAMGVLPWIAAAVPVATITAVLTGTLEGRQRFGVVNLIQVLGTIAFQAIPLVAAILVGPDLRVIVPVAVVVRVVSVLPLVMAVKSELPLHGWPLIRVARMRELLAYGSWVTLTNLVGPILDSLDRFLIGGMLGAASIAYYAVPFSLVGRTQTLPRALSRTLFPYLSADAPGQARTRAMESVIAMTAMVMPVVVLSMLLMRPFLEMWMGKLFAGHATVVGETLLCGIWLNGVATVPFAMLQAQGRPDIVAKFHLAELLPFVVLLWYGLHTYGLVGAAIAWGVRATVDAFLLFWAAGIGLEITKRMILPAVLILGALLAVRILPHYLILMRLVIGVLLLMATCVWSLRSSGRVRQEVMKVIRYVFA